MKLLDLGFSMDDPDRPLIMAADGMGVDSAAYLHLMKISGYRPDAILHADTGGEHIFVASYIERRRAWLASVGFPDLIVVRRQPMRRGKNGLYTTLEGNCLVNKTLPSLAFGRKACSMKWKQDPQHRWAKAWDLAQQTWGTKPKGRAGKGWKPLRRIIKLIGYDNGPIDSRRAWKLKSDDWYEYVYPLRMVGWSREDCIRELELAGLEVPRKSACFYCPASKPWEIAELVRDYPHLADRIIAMEANAAPNLREIEGLWRVTVKGTRGGIAKPGSMTVFINKLRANPFLIDYYILMGQRIQQEQMGAERQRHLPIAA